MGCNHGSIQHTHLLRVSPSRAPVFSSCPKFSHRLLDFKIKIVNWSLTAGGFIEKIIKEKNNKMLNCVCILYIYTVFTSGGPLKICVANLNH